jgi:hypothetical protein
MRRTNVDAKGHPILGFFDMLNYYDGDDASQRVLRGLHPSNYEVIPEITIRIIPSKLPTIYLIKVYPLRTDVFAMQINELALDALRRLFKLPRGNWTPRKEPFEVILKRRGKVVPYRGGRWEQGKLRTKE